MPEQIDPLLAGDNWDWTAAEVRANPKEAADYIRRLRERVALVPPSVLADPWFALVARRHGIEPPSLGMVLANAKARFACGCSFSEERATCCLHPSAARMALKED